MENKKYVLGLDISTTCIGVSLFEDHGEYGKLILVEHVTPKVKSKDIGNLEKIFKKADIFYDVFMDKYISYNITSIIIEEPLLRSNNVNTVATLLRFNGILSKQLFDKFGIVPEYISSYDSRKYAFPVLMAKRTKDSKGKPYTEKKIEKNEPVLFGAYEMTIDKKKVVLELVSKEFPDIVWALNKKNEIIKESYDMSDAITVVLGQMRKIGKWK